MPNPSYKQAEWIHKQLDDVYKETADDCYDVILGNITEPRDFVEEVKYWALEYEADRSRHAR